MPAGDGPVIVDTTPVIALPLVDQLGLIRSLYERVLIPPAVRAELEAGAAHGPGSADLTAALWSERVALADPSRTALIADLDPGEAEVIALGQEKQTRLGILDAGEWLESADR